MKKSIFFPVALILVFIFFVSAACNFSAGDNATETEEPQVIIITATPEIIETDQEETTDDTADNSNDTASSDSSTGNEAQPYYIEDFDGQASSYFYYLTSLDENDENEDEKLNIEENNSRLRITHNDYNLGTIALYDPYTYTDVRIDAEVENLASNNNSVALICRYDPDLGWYEYDVDNDGEWFLYYFDNVIAKEYVTLYDGGSTAIKMGRDTNTYTMICQGNEISLYINGEFTHTFKHKDLKEGQVGFGLYNYDSFPVSVAFNWFEISQP
jgi:hypothetical protein